MPTDSTQPSASARNLVQVVLQRLAKAKNQTVAEAIGKDESTVSRIVSGEVGIKLADLQPFLQALGFAYAETSTNPTKRWRRRRSRIPTL